ncbi:MAG: hypothetical protein JNN01_15995 [Opitutaceae bacterium]|nr:hypothetical protein [Opitutaceae bacterium]
MREGDSEVDLELVSYLPPGNGPFPLVVFNHGSTGTGSDPAEFTRTWHSPLLGAFFNQRGWAVVFPQRRGRGRSGGLYDEGFAADRSGYTCEPGRSLMGMERALTDLDAVVRHLRIRPEFRQDGWLIAGQSRGGILSVVYAGTRPGVFAGVVNFVGGWMSDGCANPSAINTVSFARGGAFPGPTLWIYGEADPFYRLEHSRANFDAFRGAGGKGEFLVVGPGPQGNGHFVYQLPGLWDAELDRFLAGLPGAAASAGSTGGLGNVSVRGHVGSAPLILGATVGGAEPRELILRAIGPGLKPFGVTDAVATPLGRLYGSDGKQLAEMGPWGNDPLLETAFQAVGAFPLTPGSADAARILELLPGGYTVHLADTVGASGTLLGELYERPEGSGQGLINLSVRTAIESGGGAVIVGFVVREGNPAPVLIRVAGPALGQFGVADAAARPRVVLYDGNGRRLAENAGWDDSTMVPLEGVRLRAEAGMARGAFPFASGSGDAALLVNLEPGAYTVHAQAAPEEVVLVEVYSAPVKPVPSTAR